MRLITLTKNQFAKVDDDMYEELMEYKWQAAYDKKTRSFYAIRPSRVDGNKSTIRMSRVVARAPSSKMVDHDDHDTLNNTLSNLRICTSSENACNRRPKSNSISGYKGVAFYKSTSRWVAHIRVDKKLKHLGYFKCKHDAAKAYNLAAMEYQGEFAYINIIDRIHNG